MYTTNTIQIPSEIESGQSRYSWIPGQQGSAILLSLVHKRADVRTPCSLRHALTNRNLRAFIYLAGVRWQKTLSFLFPLLSGISVPGHIPHGITSDNNMAWQNRPVVAAADSLAWQPSLYLHLVHIFYNIGYIWTIQNIYFSKQNSPQAHTL